MNFQYLQGVICNIKRKKNVVRHLSSNEERQHVRLTRVNEDLFVLFSLYYFFK